MAPPEWKDREQLWNAVEEVEIAKDSRLAREFVVALPIELNREEQVALLQEFIREQFVSDGMCADAAIHDTDGHNPHAHILLTVRPLDEQGKWQYKTEKEYLCMKNSEERGFTSAEFRTAQNEGWKKQYPYKVGKKKVYMTPSAAEERGLVRADKHPKSTRYGRQNPISERWNGEEQLAAWRAAWADVSNRHLERAGSEERIDHRSNAARGLDEIPTMECGLKKVEAQEQKYSAELDKALDEYAELKAQTADFDLVELYKARQVIRPAQEKASEQQLEAAMLSYYAAQRQAGSVSSARRGCRRTAGATTHYAQESRAVSKSSQ